MLELLVCASLVAVDGDTVKCLPTGQNMRLLGEGVPFVSGIERQRSEVMRSA